MIAAETCVCGASITVDARDVLALGWRLSDWRREHHHDLDAADACRERDEARAERDEAIRHKVELDDLRRQAKAERDEARAEVERLRGEATSGPSWDAVALRSALVAMTVERDDLRAAHERLDRDARAVAGRCLHYEARADQAEAAIARVRALCDEWAVAAPDEPCFELWSGLRAALDGEAS